LDPARPRPILYISDAPSPIAPPASHGNDGDATRASPNGIGRANGHSPGADAANLIIIDEHPLTPGSTVRIIQTPQGGAFIIPDPGTGEGIVFRPSPELRAFLKAKAGRLH
jgi:hypothetical protein